MKLMNQKGNALILGIIIGALIVIAVGGAYYLGTQKTNNALPIQNSTQSASNPTATSISTPVPPTESTNWKTYTDSTYRYSIEYPPVLSLNEKSFEKNLNDVLGAPVEQVEFDLTSQLQPYRFYWVTVYPSHNETSIKEWFKKYPQEPAANTTDYQIAGLNGIKATNLIGGTFVRQGVYVLKDNYVYSLVVSTYQFNSQINNQINNEYNRILATFKLSN